MKENRSSQREGRVRNIQLLLWTLLILIQMTVVYCLEGKAEEQPFPASEISIYIADGQEPEPVWTDKAGNHYELVSWQMISAHQPDRTNAIKETVYYEQVEGIIVFPGELTVPVTDGEQTGDVVCQLQEQTVLQEEWQEGFVFPVVFHSYGAGLYQLGDHLIAGNEVSPELAGYEALLLEQIGVSSEEYRITDVQWTGDCYLDDQGDLCREATAFGQKMVRDYQVTYVGQAEFPGRRIQQIEANYQLANRENEIGTDEAASELAEVSEIPLFSDPTDSDDSSLSPAGAWWQKVIDTLLITIGIGAVLFFGGLAILVLVHLVKRGKSWYNEKDWCRNRRKK